jgi:hypothetical protein
LRDKAPDSFIKGKGRGATTILTELRNERKKAVVAGAGSAPDRRGTRDGYLGIKPEIKPKKFRQFRNSVKNQLS